MAAFDLEEQEQLATLKAWWEKWGNLITTIAVVFAVAIVGWRGWDYYQGSKSAEAGAAYNTLIQGVERKEAQKVREASGVIAEKYGSTAYADLSALLAAQVQAESGDKASAKTKLQWAVDKANDPLLRDLARLRLAALLLDEKNYDGATKLLDTKPADAFRARYADLKGDVLSAQGKTDAAKAAYKEALDAIGKDQEAQTLKTVVELKYDALGGAQ